MSTNPTSGSNSTCRRDSITDRSRMIMIKIVVLLAVAVPLIVTAITWPIYGPACALTVAVVVAVLQIIRDHNKR
jgi:hypothetical protein